MMIATAMSIVLIARQVGCDDHQTNSSPRPGPAPLDPFLQDDRGDDRGLACDSRRAAGSDARSTPTARSTPAGADPAASVAARARAAERCADPLTGRRAPGDRFPGTSSPEALGAAPDLWARIGAIVHR